MSDFRGQPRGSQTGYYQQGTDDFSQNIPEEDLEDMLDEQIAGHPEVAAAWYGKFGPWMVVLGLLSNVFEVFTSAGGAVEFGLTSMNHTNPFASVQDAQLLVSTVVHNFPLMLFGALLLSIFCQTCIHVYVQPLQSSWTRIRSLAQKKQLAKHIKKELSFKTIVCLIAFGGNMFTNAVCFQVLFGSPVLTFIAIVVLPFMSTSVLYQGISAVDEAKHQEIIRAEATAAEIEVLRSGYESYYGSTYRR